jgi:CP family cyanate transporter-like MFS transporter
MGVLTSMPVVFFGIGAFASPAIVRRFGLDRTLLVLLVTIALGILVRLGFGYPGLLFGTALLGLAIAVANVILPSIVRARFPKRIALVTAGYTMLLGVSASLAATFAVPSSEALGGWRGALVIWVIPAVLAILVWSTQARKVEHDIVLATTEAQAARSVRVSPITWWIVLYFGIQSLGFYALLSWLPTILIDGGATPSRAGFLLGVMTFVGVPFALFLSTNLGRLKNLSLAASLSSVVTLAGFILLLTPFDLVAVIVVGLGQALTFPVALNLISTKGSTAAQTTELSTLSQGIGYLVSAAGTFAFGLLGDLTNAWAIPVVFLAALTLIQIWAGFAAGRAGQIENPVA